MTDRFETRRIILVDEQRRRLAVAMIENAPLGIEVVGREQVKARKQDQNSLMWAGPLKDIADQAWVKGRKFDAETWHEHFKREFLPDEDDPELERKVKDHENWKKWTYLPDGERVLVGTTTRLTVYGMSQYLEEIFAFGADLGVMFTTLGGHGYEG